METKEQIIEQIGDVMSMTLGATLSALEHYRLDKQYVNLQKIDAESFVECVGNYIEEIKRLVVKL
jgi:hypothetical protein